MALAEREAQFWSVQAGTCRHNPWSRDQFDRTVQAACSIHGCIGRSSIISGAVCVQSEEVSIARLAMSQVIVYRTATTGKQLSTIASPWVAAHVNEWFG
jgi:hypothetical protein